MSCFRHAQDERVVWRGARSLRELILKDENVKNICYDSTIEVWLIKLMEMYPDSSVVQGHSMRLIGALAFGNDRFRRKVGEKGIMKCITDALQLHPDDETVLLHVSTAITNLTHNSMENRSRFVELNGVDLFISMIIRFKESAKLQRQACWAILSLCGTDEISRSIAQRGGDSAIMNSMLLHRLVVKFVLFLLFLVQMCLTSSIIFSSSCFCLIFILQRYDAGVQQFGCWALSNLALSGEEIARKMKKKGVIEVNMSVEYYNCCLILFVFEYLSK